MAINRLHHVGMSVPDLEKGISFYRDVLGFEEAASVGFDANPTVDAILGLREAKAKVAFLRRDSLWIEMFEFSSPQPRPKDKRTPVCEYGISHLCLDVSNVDELYAHCVAKGMQFHSSPVATHGVKTTYGRDPFGTVIELQEITNQRDASDNWQFDGADAA